MYRTLYKWKYLWNNALVISGSNVLVTGYAVCIVSSTFLLMCLSKRKHLAS